MYWTLLFFMTTAGAVLLGLVGLAGLVNETYWILIVLGLTVALVMYLSGRVRCADSEPRSGDALSKYLHL